jgi:hypothetical protein
MVKHHPMTNPRAAIVSNEPELLMAERPHHGHLVGGHRPETVVRVVVASGRLGTVSIPAQIAGHDGVLLGEARGDLMPHRMRLGRTVKQEDGRAITTVHQIDLDTIHGDALLREPGKHGPTVPPLTANGARSGRSWRTRHGGLGINVLRHRAL